MRFNTIGKTILLALSLTAIIVAMSCSGADATKPEDLKADLGKELGTGRNTTQQTTADDTNTSTKYILVTPSFFSGLPTISGYTTNGAGISVTGILKVTRTNTSGAKEDITGIATPVYNDAGGVYRINISDTAITNVEIEYSYKLKLAPARVTNTTPTKIGINTNATNLTYLDLYTEIAGSSEGSLFGKTYVIGTTNNINYQPTIFSNGLITNNILTNLSIPSNNGVYKLWIY